MFPVLSFFGGAMPNGIFKNCRWEPFAKGNHRQIVHEHCRTAVARGSVTKSVAGPAPSSTEVSHTEFFHTAVWIAVAGADPPPPLTEVFRTGDFRLAVAGADPPLLH